jgi:hypothetical protein
MTTSDPSGAGGKDEAIRMFGELENQRKEAGEIVQRWFRFRARRGLGVMYLLLSLSILVGIISYDLTASIVVAIVCGTIVGVFASISGRLAGAQNFGKMTRTIWLLKEDSTRKQSSEIYWTLLRSVAFLWPWLAYAAAVILGLPAYAILFASAWLIELVIYRVLAVRRNKNPILEQRAEDWLVLLAFPIAAMVSLLPIFPSGALFSAFILLSPLFLIAGLKSLYEAPKELVNSLDERK